MGTALNQVEQKRLLSQSGLPQDTLWRNMGIEKYSSQSWMKSIYRNSFLKAFWTMIKSPV